MVVSHDADDGQPHREMAVDVPDSFVARNKTPPRYPPPKPTLTVSILVQFNYLIIFLGNDYWMIIGTQFGQSFTIIITKTGHSLIRCDYNG